MAETFHCIVSGSRGFTDYGLMCERLDSLLQDYLPRVEIIEGGAEGADMLAARYAVERGLAVYEFTADWEKHGRAAAYVRDQEMFEYASQYRKNACVLFLNDKKRGTKNDIELGRRYHVPTAVIRSAETEE